MCKLISTLCGSIAVTAIVIGLIFGIIYTIYEPNTDGMIAAWSLFGSGLMLLYLLYTDEEYSMYFTKKSE